MDTEITEITLGERLALIRRRHKISQKELASAAGVSVGFIVDCEADKDINTLLEATDRLIAVRSENREAVAA